MVIGLPACGFDSPPPPILSVSEAFLLFSLTGIKGRINLNFGEDEHFFTGSSPDLGNPAGGERKTRGYPDSSCAWTLIDPGEPESHAVIELQLLGRMQTRWGQAER